MDNQISILEIYAGVIQLPDGLIVDPQNGIYLDPKKITDRGKLFDFMSRVIGPIVPSENYPSTLQVGNFLVANEVIDPDPIFGKSIIRIGPYKPLIQHVDGIGVIKGHPSAQGFPGWSLDHLANEIKSDYWRLMDKVEVTNYARQQKIELDLMQGLR